MAFHLDYSEVSKFLGAAKKLQEDYNRFLRSFLAEQAERVVAKVKPRTPKDTGALRRSWKIGKMTGSGETLEVEILNPMEYATDIEYGHRIVVGHGKNKKEVGWYNGHFMLKISMDEVRNQMQARYDKEFADFCKQRGVE